MNDPNLYPPGLDAKQVREIIEYYDSLTEEEWIAELEAADEDPRNTVMVVPTELVPAIRELIFRHEADVPGETVATD
jgi:hypothetical protein